MDNGVLVALISGTFTLLGSFGGIMASSRLSAYRIQKLEEKVEKHNNAIERIYNLEKHNEVQDEKLDETDRRVALLEGYHRAV